MSLLTEETIMQIKLLPPDTQEQVLAAMVKLMAGTVDCKAIEQQQVHPGGNEHIPSG